MLSMSTVAETMARQNRGLKSSDGLTYAIVLLLVYSLGFITLNAYLFNYNITELEYTNPRVLIAACNFLLFLFCFYIFAGRAALNMPSWLNDELKLIETIRFRLFWQILFFIFSFIHAVFLTCLSAVLFFKVAIPYSQSLSFLNVLIGCFFFVYAIDFFNLDKKTPRTAVCIRTAIEVFAIYKLFTKDINSTLFCIFGIYVVIFLLINLVIDRYERKKTIINDIVYDVLFSIVFLILLAGFYGTFIYGSVSKQLGGGQTTEVKFTSIKNIASVLTTTKMNSNTYWSGLLIHQSQASTYIKLKTLVVKIPNDAMIIITSKKAESKSSTEK